MNPPPRKGVAPRPAGHSPKLAAVLRWIQAHSFGQIQNELEALAALKAFLVVALIFIVIADIIWTKAQGPHIPAAALVNPERGLPLVDPPKP